MTKTLITTDDHELALRLKNLRNRFLCVNFTQQDLNWAITALDPNTDDNWTHDAYIYCFGAGKNN